MEPAVSESILDAGDFFVPPPGHVRVERDRVWLHRPDYPSDRPIVEVRRDDARIEVHRNIAMRGGGGGGWLGEFVGSAPPDRPDVARRCVGLALTGTSRLAIASVETPHPAFALGMVAYLPADAEPLVKLEARLRAGTPVNLPTEGLADLLRELFNRLALSPWTPLVERLIALVLTLDQRSALDVLGYMLRHLARHLSAFDLVKFHNLGANYPDALMLDSVLRAFVPLLDERAATKMDRRALRQGWLARRRCEGLRIPDHPTSPGDNVRLLPHPALPEPQLTEPSARSKRLFSGEPAEAMLTPAARELLRRSVDDLSDVLELRELGTATFLDRPLGYGRRDEETDRTPLLSYEACSVRVIKSRLTELLDARLIDEARLAALNPSPPAAGFAVARLPGHARRGAVSLEDAKKVALDFVFTRTTQSSLDALLRQYDWSAVNAVAPGPYHLLIRTARSRMTAFDGSMSPLVELELPQRPVYLECGGVEYVEDLCAVVAGQRLPLPPRVFS